MKKLLFLLITFSVSHVFAQQRIVIDTHSDAISDQLITKADLSKLQTVGSFDLVRAKQGGLSGQVFSIWCGEKYGTGRAFAFANREIDSVYALVRRNPGKMALVHNSAELKKAIAQHKLAAMLGVEGGHMIEDRIDYLDSLAKRGMVYLTLTWNNSTSWATSAQDETLKKDSLPHKGLTPLGKQIIHRMNELGVMVDLSHVGEQTFYDALATSSKPVIASHSCSYTLNPHRRNLKDAQLKAMAKKDGVVFLNFYSGFLDSTYDKKKTEFFARHRQAIDSLYKIHHDETFAIASILERYPAESTTLRPPLSLLIKHIDYMVKLIGADHVGIGADFDGAESYPMGMDSVADYPKIAQELQKLGYSSKAIDQIMSGNFMRVFKANTGK